MTNGAPFTSCYRCCRAGASRGQKTVAVASAVIVLALAGCGGSSDPPTTNGQARACFFSTPGMRVAADQTDLDFIAEQAPGGGFDGTVGSTDVTLAFGETREDAKRIVSAYRTLGKAFDYPLDDILDASGNVAVAWSSSPSDEERAMLDACI